jgi:hypothetical protein
MKAKRNIAIILLLTLTMITILGCSKSMQPEEPVAPPAAEIPATQPAVVAVEPEAPTEIIQKPSGTEEIAVTNDVITETATTSVTLSIDCLTALDNPDKLDPNKVSLLPKDGFFLPAKEIALNPGETVFDVLLRETRANGIHMEFSRNPALKSSYVEGIGNLYEFDCGELSGWTYLVNGKGIGYGSSSYILADGDVVEWRYTCDQGRDVSVTAE